MDNPAIPPPPRAPGVLVLAAPVSGSGKTLISLGLIGALKKAGLRVAAAKTGPDYIDTAFLSRAAGSRAFNLDPWSMAPAILRQRALEASSDHDLLLVEGVMGLFDGAANGAGSTADLAASLGAPVILIVDAARQSQSIAPLVAGFAHWRQDVNIAGLILNNVGSMRHVNLLRDALAPLQIPLVGIIPRQSELVVPSRHLGLVFPDELEGRRFLMEQAATLIGNSCDLELLCNLAVPLAVKEEKNGTRPVSDLSSSQVLPPLGQHVAIARDAAFAFMYQHWLHGWKRAGARLSFFSPLADQSPDPKADAVFLPGGYPELHGAQLTGATKFLAGLRQAAQRGALIYGECGGYMVLGRALTGRDGTTHAMASLLPHATRIDMPRRTLGYRVLTHSSPLPWPSPLAGHEFHYSSSHGELTPPLFEGRSATGERCGAMGTISGNVMGSYAHVIDAMVPEASPLNRQREKPSEGFSAKFSGKASGNISGERA